MSAILLVLLGAAAGFVIDELFFNNDDDDENRRVEGEGNAVRVDQGLVNVGSDGADTYVFDSDATGGITASIDAGAGDDIIDLASLFGNPGMFGSDIAGGAGNDLIAVEGSSNTISGGEGDDTIAFEGFVSNINGDAGDDLIRVVALESDPAVVDGGAGNDTIDITGSVNIVATGGEGDDVLINEGRTIIGTGYVIGVDGGEGDDTLNHNSDIFPIPGQDPAEAAALLTGGEGADEFNITLSNGEGSFSASNDDPDVYVNRAAYITDFEQGSDVLSIEIPSFLVGYAADTATLEEDATSGTTTFTIDLITAGISELPDQEVTIVVNATGLTWSDVTFTGQTPMTLAVV